MVALTVAAGLLLSSPVLAQDAAQAQLAAQEGAGHFKAKQFLKAARAFERAFRHDPTDARLVRYAGRSWQEVGHWDRARRLLERYLQLEQNPEHRASILAKLAKLRKMTPLGVAESLLLATKRFPLGRLERDAAMAYERVGSERGFKQALNLYETARLSAGTAVERGQIDAAITRVQGNLMKLKSGVEPASLARPATPTTLTMFKPPPAAASDTVGTVLYIVGGVVVAAGGTMAAMGYMQAARANDEWTSDKDLPLAERHFKSFKKYKTEKEAGGSLHLAGLGVVGGGGAVILWAVVRGLTKAPGRAAWQVAPMRTSGGAGLVFGRRF